MSVGDVAVVVGSGLTFAVDEVDFLTAFDQPQVHLTCISSCEVGFYQVNPYICANGSRLVRVDIFYGATSGRSDRIVEAAHGFRVDATRAAISTA